MPRRRDYRVVCDDYTQEVADLQAAITWRARTEVNCRNEHRIEVRRDGEWLPVVEVMARDILAASLLDKVETWDGPLVVASGGWSPESGARADATLRGRRVNYEEYVAVLGPHDWAFLSGDGGAVGTGWCSCEAAPDAETWVRYERWTAEGRTGHGYLCPTCREITQTG